MAIDLARVGQVYVQGQTNSYGSAYLVAEGVALTAAHVITDAGLQLGDAIEVLPEGAPEWLPATIAWLDPSGHIDGALIRLNEADQWVANSTVRWGHLPKTTPVPAAAIGFPASQETEEGVRARESVVGFITPPINHDGKIPLHALSSTPQDLPSGNPWAGMSGAALVTGPHIVGVLVVSPGGYGTDRLEAIPASELLLCEGFSETLGVEPKAFTVGDKWKLQYGGHSHQTITLDAPYKQIPPGFDISADPYRLLRSEHKLVDFHGRQNLLDGLTNWAAQDSRPLAIKAITGKAGSGKTRLAAEACLALSEQGWDTGFTAFHEAQGETRYELESPTFMVFDNADLRVQEIAKVVRSLIYSDTKVRLVLMARSRKSWWGSFHLKSDGNANGYFAGEISLDDHPLSENNCRRLFSAAHACFSRKLWGKSSELLANQIVEESCGNPSTVLISALVLALHHPEKSCHTSSRAVRSSIIRTAVDYEANRWVEAFCHEGHAEEERVLRRCVGTASLANPRPSETNDCATLEQAAVSYLRSVPDLCDANTSRVISLATWLHQLNGGPSYWNPMYPDILADQLLADMDALPDLAEKVVEVAITHNDVDTVAKTIIGLARAAESSGGAAKTALQRLFSGGLRANDSH